MAVTTSSPSNPFYFSPLQFWLLLCAGSLLALSLVSSLMFLREYQSKIYPGVMIDSVPVGGLTKEEAKRNLAQLSAIPDYMIEVAVDDIAITSSSAELKLSKNIDKSIEKAISYGKNGPWWLRVRELLTLQTTPHLITSEWQYESTVIESMVTHLKQQVDDSSQEPSARLKSSGSPQSLQIFPGKAGRSLDVSATLEKITTAPIGRDLELDAVVASTGAQLTAEQVDQALARSKKLVGQSLALTGPQLTKRLQDQDLVSLLAFPEGYSLATLETIIENWKKEIERPPQDAEFVYDPTTLKVTTFIPHRDGLAVDEKQTLARLTELLTEIETNENQQSQPFTGELPLIPTSPSRTLATTNDLGINELIGFGESEYDHSIPNRIHNVSLTANRLNLIILKPNEEFSFNKALGEVSAATGYKPAYVIKDGQTVLGDGGGVCQVSTTIFRSVLNAGLPITKRKAHSYRVSYYELNSKPGVDATVYAGDVDLRFINDTGHHVLLLIDADSQDLYMKVEMYGTSDGRSTEIVDHITWDARPAPPPVFIPDPFLAPGQKKQVDFAASGIKARFTNIVRDKAGQEIRRDTYTSNYVPWSAKYLVGP